VYVETAESACAIPPPNGANSATAAIEATVNLR
jgi:hypothetical protein